MGSILWVPVIMACATVYLYVLSISLPSLSEEQRSVLKFPSSLEDLQAIVQAFSTYRQTHENSLLLLFSSAYFYKQTFSIPGSFFLNVLAGALFGPYIGLALVCLLTAAGATCCFSLSKYFGRSYVVHYFPDQIKGLQSKVEENQDGLFFFLLFMRAFPMSPNWLLNIVLPLVGVPIHVFFLSVFVGLMPYNFICVQTGGLLSQVTSLDAVFTWPTMFKLLGVAVAALLPGLVLKYYKNKNPKQEKVH